MPDQLEWTFLPPTTEATDEHRIKLRLQVMSDIYRALQTRLDGYRQSAAAIFLGVIAGLLTLDASIASAFGRILVGDDVPPAARLLLVHHRIGWIILASGFVLLAAGLFIHHILEWIHYYFAEMSGVVYKFDVANKVFGLGEWLAGQTLYPMSFRTTRRLDIAGEELLVWFDPSIGMFLMVVRIVFILNILAFWSLGAYMLIPK